MTPERRDERMASERRGLEQADRHIRVAGGRVERLEELLRELTGDGHDVGHAEAFLRTFRDVLVGFLDHRVLIVAKLDRLAALIIPGDPA